MRHDLGRTAAALLSMGIGFRLLFLIALFAICLPSAAHANGYCGDDVCGPGESCNNCRWDCGVCEDREGSGGTPIGKPPEKKSMVVWYEEGFLEYPIDTFSYTRLENDSRFTFIRLKVRNEQNMSLPPLRIRLQAFMSWFRPEELEYRLEPDGFDGDGWPYWDNPPLDPNESLELAFRVNGSVGFANLIEIKADPLERWRTGCAYPAALDNATSAKLISDFLDSINLSGNVSVLYEQKSGNATLALARLLDKESFGVFLLNGTKVSVVSGKEIIGGLVLDYADANSKETTANLSRLHGILLDSRDVKEGPEASCMVITGMDRFSCVDRVTCFYSCFSVPVCSMIATGWPFIDTMLDYRKSIDEANIAMNRSIISAEALLNDPGYWNALQALADMKELNKAGTRVMYHPIFTQYNFCEPADYALMQQIEGKRILYGYLEANCLYGEIPEIVNQSQVLALELASLVNASEEARENETNAGISPDVNVTTPLNVTDLQAEEEMPEGDCCFFGLCSVAGIERSWGVCWHWWALMTGILLICSAYLLLKRKGRAKPKI